MSDEKNGNEEANSNSTGTNPFVKILSIFVTLALIVGFKMIFGYFRTEVEVAASKYSSWSPEYRKSFIRECLVNAKIKTESDFSSQQLMNPKIQDAIKIYTEAFCDCGAKGIEESHVVNTKYNRMGRSLAEAEKDTEQQMLQFLKTPEGKKVIKDCDDQAVAMFTSKTQQND